MPIPRISSRTHGVLDYTTGAALLAAPNVLGLRGTAAGAVLRAAGAGTIGYSLLTAYELGVAKVVPYRAHLAVDAVAAVGLAAAPIVAGRSGRRAQWLPHGLFGLWEIAAVALSVPGATGGTAAGAAEELAASDVSTDGGASDGRAATGVVATEGGATDGRAAPDVVTTDGGATAGQAAPDEASTTGAPASTTDPTQTVMPEGADVALADRGAAARRDGLGGAGPDPKVGGLQT